MSLSKKGSKAMDLCPYSSLFRSSMTFWGGVIFSPYSPANPLLAVEQVDLVGMVERVIIKADRFVGIGNHFRANADALGFPE